MASFSTVGPGVVGTRLVDDEGYGSGVAVCWELQEPGGGQAFGEPGCTGTLHCSVQSEPDW